MKHPHCTLFFSLLFSLTLPALTAQPTDRLNDYAPFSANSP